MEYFLENILMYTILIAIAIVIWKLSKTVISMVIGFVVLVIVGILIWYVYKTGLPNVAEGSGYFVVFVEGVKVLVEKLKEVML